MPTGGHALVEPSPLQRLLPYQHRCKLPFWGGACILRTQSSGDLMARAINDIGLVRALLGSGIRSILVNLTMVAASIGRRSSCVTAARHRT